MSLMEILETPAEKLLRRLGKEGGAIVKADEFSEKDVRLEMAFGRACRTDSGTFILLSQEWLRNAQKHTVTDE